jgi:Cu-Zn family superoxide dismutase
MDCCKISRRTKKCKRRSDGKIFKLPRRFTKKKCRNVRGFSMKSSCAPYKDCFRGGGKSKQHKASAYIDMNGITGKVLFLSNGNSCKIKYSIKGLPNGKHGFHIHRCGDLTKGCSGGCDHFNPTNSTHGGLHSSIRHAGDLGNINSKKGTANGRLMADDLSCDPLSKYSIIGRMIIIHADEDDLGKGNNDESKITGNAGKRIACAVIGRAE